MKNTMVSFTLLKSYWGNVKRMLNPHQNIIPAIPHTGHIQKRGQSMAHEVIQHLMIDDIQDSRQQRQQQSNEDSFVLCEKE
jgi:hypothetical protein